jgi:putative colanic acid biosynthesis UDP-glucose lipid carrier transferase
MPHAILPKRPLLILITALVEPLLPWIAALLATPLVLRQLDVGAEALARYTALLDLSALLLVQQPNSLEDQLAVKSRDRASALFLRWLAVAALVFAMWEFTTLLDIPRRYIVEWLLLTLAILLVTGLALRKLVRVLLRNAATVRRVVVAGCNEKSRLLEDRIRANNSLHMEVLGYFDDRAEARLAPRPYAQLVDRLDALPAYVEAHGIDVIFIALPIAYIKRVQHLLDALHDTTVSVYYVPGTFAFDLIQSRPVDLDGVHVISLCETPFVGYGGVFKRLFDLVVTSLIMIPATPFMLAIAALVKATSPGPALFKQVRYGLDGDRIEVYKFRSMRVMENGAEVKQATIGDDRITPLGRVLRKTSMDELPQLINVLQGSMSLVGPRPHAVAHNETYRRLIKGYMLRHKAIPGITGLAQVRGWRGETKRIEEMEARVRCDLDYLRHWSPLLDLKILALTAVKLVRPDSKAY